jgi:hypothetical protein
MVLQDRHVFDFIYSYGLDIDNSQKNLFNYVLHEAKQTLILILQERRLLALGTIAHCHIDSPP